MSEAETKTAEAVKRSSGAFAFQVFCALIFLGMIGMVFYNAVLRYALNSGYPPSEEWARFFFIYITFFGAIEAFYRKKMIAVDMVVDMLQGASRKAVAVIAHLATIFALAIMLQGGITYIDQTLDTYAVATHINMTWINITLPVMAAVSILIIIRDLVTVLRTPSSEFKKAEK